MPSGSPSKQRLEELIALARTYRGWSSKDLARELGRDVHHLVPNSGVPKLDIVIALAEALDWTVQDVVDDLCGNVPAAPKSTKSTKSPKSSKSKAEPEVDADSFAALNRAAWDAWQAGEYERMVLFARHAYVAASSPNERGIACIREFSAWDCLGRYQLALEAVQRGLADGPTEDDVAGPLRNNLGYCHYILGQHEEAVGVATALIEELESGELSGPCVNSSRGFAHFVRGVAIRERVASGAQVKAHRSRRAIADLTAASELLDRFGRENDAPASIGIGMTARGALMTLRALTGEIPARTAIDATLERLEEVIDPTQSPSKHVVEAIGWWCVFGCEVANLKLNDEDQRLHALGVLTNKVDEISQVTGNWALRERVWRLEVLRRLGADGGAIEPWVIDRSDARDLTGAMARFPHFRAIGWQVFRAAEIGDEP